MNSRKYDPDRDVTPEYLATVAAWIAASGEVFVVLRYLAGAGSRDYAFCRTMSEFHALVEAAPTGTDIEVFRTPQLPLRGVVTDRFIASALAIVEPGSEYMVVAMQRRANSVLSIDDSLGDTHEDLLAALEGFRNQEVAMGPCPAFIAPDGADLVSASKGGIDGPR